MNKPDENTLQENNKIQINFKNSFVTQRTQEKYDKIIDNNNKRNNDKIEKNLENDLRKIEESENFRNVIYLNNESDKFNKNFVKEIQYNQSKNLEMPNKINNIIPEKNNESGMVLIEEISYFKTKLNDTNLTQEKEIVNHMNDNQSNNKYQIFPIIDETLKYDSEEECRVKGKKEEEINNIPEIQENNQNILDDSQEETYDKFLLESVRPKTVELNGNKHSQNLMHNLLREQMKNIIHNIKDRKKDTKCLKNEKKKFLLNNLEPQTNIDLKNNIECHYQVTNTKNQDKLVNKDPDKTNEVYEQHVIPNEYQEDFLREEIKINNDDVLDDEELTTIHHQSIRHEDDKPQTQEENIYQNFNLEQFIKENTQDEINEEITNYEEEDQRKNSNTIHSNRFADNRLIIFNNQEDPYKA
jgi:hypothetical protein